MVFGIWENKSTVDCRLFEMNPVAIDLLFRICTQARKYITLSANTLSNQNNRIPNQIDLMRKTVCARMYNVQPASWRPIHLWIVIYHLWLVSHQRNIKFQFIGNWIELHVKFRLVFGRYRNSWHLKFWFIMIILFLWNIKFNIKNECKEFLIRLAQYCLYHECIASRNFANKYVKISKVSDSIKFSHLHTFSIIWHWAFESFLKVDYVHWPAVLPKRDSYNSFRIRIGSDFHMFRVLSLFWFHYSIREQYIHITICELAFAFLFFTLRIKILVEWCYLTLSMTAKQNKI